LTAVLGGNFCQVGLILLFPLAEIITVHIPNVDKKIANEQYETDGGRQGLFLLFATQNYMKI
jgi:hypothetical protein